MDRGWQGPSSFEVRGGGPGGRVENTTGMATSVGGGPNVLPDARSASVRVANGRMAHALKNLGSPQGSDITVFFSFLPPDPGNEAAH